MSAVAMDAESCRAFLAGRSARQSGVGASWCPYRIEEDPLREQWLQGWHQRDEEAARRRGVSKSGREVPF